MRITGGEFGGRNLKVPKSDAIRPTQDRVREALFNIIQFEVPGSDFLDLFAGSGAVGLEALSRGAKSVTFVERERRHLAVLNENIGSLGSLGSRRVDVGSSRVDVGSSRVDVGSRRVDVGSRRVDVGSSRVDVGSRPVDVGASRGGVGSSWVDVGSSRVDVGSSRGGVGSSRVDVGSSRVDVGTARLSSTLNDTTVVAADAYRWISSYSGPGFSIGFADPPYALGEEKGYASVLATLASRGVIRAGGLFVAEMTSVQKAEETPGWELVRDRTYGKTRLCIWRRLLSEGSRPNETKS